MWCWRPKVPCCDFVMDPSSGRVLNCWGAASLMLFLVMAAVFAKLHGCWLALQLAAPTDALLSGTFWVHMKMERETTIIAAWRQPCPAGTEAPVVQLKGV